MGLKLNLFGEFEAQNSEQKVVKFSETKGKWLLALLALNYGREVSREVLAQTLWPSSDHPGQDVRQYLRRCLMKVRKVLGDDKDCIFADPNWLKLDLTQVEIDLIAFDRDIRKKQDVDVLERAVILRQRGTLLIECTKSWVVGEREKRDLQYAEALSLLGEEARSRRDYTKAVYYYRLEKNLEVLSERPYQTLMRVYLEMGELRLGIETYKELTIRFHDDLRWQPSTAVKDLYTTIQKEYERRATHTTKVVASFTSITLPPVRKIPLPPTALIGREQERGDILRLMETPRVLSLIGPGGVGKSRLALSLATNLSETHSLSAWFVDLSSVAKNLDLDQHLCVELSVPRSSGMTADASLIDFLNQQPSLLVLDNCEHLIDPCQRTVDRLQSSCPKLRILLTSQQPLNLSSEKNYPVSPLSTPDVSRRAHTPEELMNSDAIQLFIERVRAVQPDFKIDADNSQDIVRLCQRLDGLPLAIELAAAWGNTLTPQQMVQHLVRRFHLLDSGRTGELTRWQTLQGMIAASYDRLTPAEQQFLRCFAVFSGGCSLETVERFFLKGDGNSKRDVLHLLTSLVNKNLVRRQQGVQGEFRFSLLESIRDYCHEQLEKDEEAEKWKRCHAEIYAELAEAYNPSIAGPKQRRAGAILSAEQGNFDVALQWCKSNPNSVELGMRIALPLSWLWEKNGYLTPGRTMLRALLNANPEVDPILRMLALKMLGILAWRQSDLIQASIDLKASLEISVALGDSSEKAQVLANLGTVARLRKQYEEALQFLGSALEIERAQGDKDRIATNLNNMGFAAFEKENYPATRLYLNEALQIRQEIGDNSGKAYALVNLARLEQKEGRVLEAIALFEQARATFEEFGNQLEIARSFHNLGYAYKALNDQPKALARLREGLRRFWPLEAWYETSVALIEVAALLPPEHPTKIVRLFGAARALQEKIGVETPDFDADGDDVDIVAFREQLGTNFFSEWSKGRQMTIEQAVILALTD